MADASEKTSWSGMPGEAGAENRLLLATGTRAICLLQKEGLSLADCLGILLEDVAALDIGKAFLQVRNGIAEGKSVAASMREAGFPALYVQVVAAGEETGKLFEALALIADDLERELLRKAPMEDGDHLALALRRMAMTMSLGLPLIPAIGIAADNMEHAGLGQALLDVKKDVAAGVPFGEAMVKRANVFGIVLARYLEAGERSGRLDRVLVSAADFLDRILKIRYRRS